MKKMHCGVSICFNHETKCHEIKRLKQKALDELWAQVARMQRGVPLRSVMVVFKENIEPTPFYIKWEVRATIGSI